MVASAISNLLRKNVGAGLARVSLNKNIIRNYFSLVFSVDKRAFKRRVWFDFKYLIQIMFPGIVFQHNSLSVLMGNEPIPKNQVYR